VLVLSRKEGESIILDGDIEFTVLGIERDQVKIGIKAPKEIKIWREEIYLAILEQQKIAAHLNVEKEVEKVDNLRDFLLNEIDAIEE
jgi:carbon storage regulator